MQDQDHKEESLSWRLSAIPKYQKSCTSTECNLKKSLPKQRGPLLPGKGQILCKEEDPENYRPWDITEPTPSRPVDCGKSWLDPRGRSLLQKDVLSQPISVENGFTMVAFNQTQKRCKVPYLPAWCRLCCFSLWRLSFTSCFPSFLVATLISGPTAPGDTKIGNRTNGCTVKTDEKTPNHMLQNEGSSNTTSLIPSFFLVKWLHRNFALNFHESLILVSFYSFFKHLNLPQCTFKKPED